MSSANTAAVLTALAVAATNLHAGVGVRPSASAPSCTTAPTSRPASKPFTSPGTSQVRIDVPGRGAPAVCWIARPDGYAAGQRPPLIVCLHGTDDTAEQMIAFWRARQMRIPAVLVAPQGVGKGWSSGDVPAIQAMFDRLPDMIWYDSHRVLLAGFSAGGAMTFQMIYKEKVPVTAAACLANYVPPRLTAEDIRARRRLPVFYAVGMSDVNHELMRTGLDFLRSAGANVELYHPAIGHVLDPTVAQAAVDWFYDQCSRQIDVEIESADKGSEVGPAAGRLEQIVSQPKWHEPRHVAAARRTLAALEAPAELALQDVAAALRDGRATEAVQTLRDIELKYGISRLGIAARTRREQIEGDPALRVQIQQTESRARADRALSEYQRAQKLVAQAELAEAAEVCRHIARSYGDTPAAERARRLLSMLEPGSTP